MWKLWNIKEMLSKFWWGYLNIKFTHCHTLVTPLFIFDSNITSVYFPYAKFYLS